MNQISKNKFDDSGRELPIPGHDESCPHGQTGWAYCTCHDEDDVMYSPHMEACINCKNLEREAQTRGWNREINSTMGPLAWLLSHHDKMKNEIAINKLKFS